MRWIGIPLRMCWRIIGEVILVSRSRFHFPYYGIISLTVLDLIQSFLWMAIQKDKMEETSDESTTKNNTINTTPVETQVLSELPEDTIPVPQQVKPSHSSKNAKAKRKKAPTKKQEPVQEPDKSLIETKEEMYERLTKGVDFVNDKVKGMRIAGTIENPVITTKTVTYPEEQANRLIFEISEIKHLLFCRLLLGHAALLPAALHANSLEEFLADPGVTPGALRDLCLKMENPGLQEIRDACADLFRADEEDDDDTEILEEVEEKEIHPHDLVKPFKKQKGELPDKWISKREQTKNAAEEMGMMPTYENVVGGEGTAVNFGKVEDKVSERKIRVKICGRSIWNYPSNKAMSRGGWLHFCIIAKDSDLNDAIALCRHWDEFFELNILVIWGYFPGKNWSNWAGNRYRQQMLQDVSKCDTLHGTLLTSYRDSSCISKPQSQMQWS